MINEIIICQKCGSWDVDLTKHRSRWHWRNIVHLISGKSIYTCLDCGWQGCIIEAKNLSLMIAFFMGVAIVFLFLLAYANT